MPIYPNQPDRRRDFVSAGLLSPIEPVDVAGESRLRRCLLERGGCLLARPIVRGRLDGFSPPPTEIEIDVADLDAGELLDAEPEELTEADLVEVGP